MSPSYLAGARPIPSLSDRWGNPDLKPRLTHFELLPSVQDWASVANSQGYALAEAASSVNRVSAEGNPTDTCASKFRCSHPCYVSSNLYLIPDPILEPILFPNSTSTPTNYIRALSKELYEAYKTIASLQRELSSLREQLFDAQRAGWLYNPDARSQAFDYTVFGGAVAKRSALGRLSGDESLDRGMDFLGNLIKGEPVQSAYYPNHPYASTRGGASNGDKMPAYPAPSLNYDSDEPSEDTCSDSSSKDLAPVDNSASFKEAVATERRPPNRHPRPFHFRAIALASKLLSSSSKEAKLNPNSKRASKRITSWTLSLLRGANVDQAENTESDFHLEECEPPKGARTPSEYELDVHPPKTFPQVPPNIIPLIFPEPSLGSGVPSCIEHLSPVKELPELLSGLPQVATCCVEMTPLSAGPRRSRRSSLTSAPVSLASNSTHDNAKDGECLALSQSSCTSPTIGISTLTTRGCSSVNPSLPAVSKLLSRIIDPDEGPRAPTTEERWAAFMDAHAPKIEPIGLPSTLCAGAASHPLARPPSLSLSFDGPAGGGYLGAPRKRLVLSRLSSEERRELRRLARAGIPHPFRAKVWYECSGAAQMFEVGYFQGLATEAQGPFPFKEQIELDLHRTMPNHRYFSRDGPGAAKLRRVLLTYSVHNPNVGYCQSMNLIAATLLLTLTSEEEAFWTLASVIERILPPGYFTSDLLVSQADQRVLGDYVADYLPRLAAHFNRLAVDVGAITFNWFLTLYSDGAPFHVVLRIWDVLLVEGAATLFRWALALLDFHEVGILARGTSSAVYSYLKGLPLDAGRQLEKVAHLAFCVYKPRVSYDEVQVRRQRHLASLRAQLGLQFLP
ncbi:hypothetical protein L0F63_003720 [Massospora cicadina]|nr:hypothetical protein L0F63_003720 [Massospora cicadina]